MSANKNSQHQDHSIFDNMSTSELKEILLKDSFNENNETDVDTVLYITEVIAKRKECLDNANVPSADTAWKKFNEKYRDKISDSSSLYDFEEDVPIADVSNSKSVPAKTKNPKTHKKFNWLLRTAAAVVTLVLIGTITVNALGFNLWKTIASWSKDLFNYSTEQDVEEKSIPEVLEPLAIVMQNNGLHTSLIPKYIPENCKFVSVKNASSDESIFILCQLTVDDEPIIIQYTTHSETDDNVNYQKDATDPEIYETSSNRFYIVTNFGTYNATWISNGIEGMIYGISSKDELIKILNSINEV